MPMQRQEENSLPPEGGAGVAQLADRRHWFQVSPLARVRSLLVRNRILSYLFSGGRILIRVQGEWVLVSSGRWSRGTSTILPAALHSSRWRLTTSVIR